MVSISLELDAYEYRRFQKALATAGKTADQLVSDFLADGECTPLPAPMVHAPDAAVSAQGRGDMVVVDDYASGFAVVSAQGRGEETEARRG